MTGQTTGSGSAAPWTPPSVEELDRLLPQYEIDELLGRGGMGAVYKGRQASLGRTVAIKVLPETLATKAEAEGGDPHQYVERFKLEARSMANLDHPAIISVYDFGQTDAGHLYFVMEFIDGMDIEQYIRASGGTVDSEHAVAIVSHVLDALEYAHSQGVVHRDIKPANVLINQQGRVKIADFGLAKVAGGSADAWDGEASVLTGLTMTDMAMGTPDYIAPEALEEGVTPDHRADLYAVGVMLYKMLTGKLPRGIFQLPSEANAALDPRFDELISKSMASQPGGRFQSASEFRHRLGLMISEPVSRVEAGAPTEAVKPPAERKFILPESEGAVASGAVPRSGPLEGRSQAVSRSQSRAMAKQSAAPTKRSPAALVGAVVAALLVIGGVVFVVLNRGGDSGMPSDDSVVSAATDESAPSPLPEAQPSVDPGPATPAIDPKVSAKATVVASSTAGGSPPNAISATQELDSGSESASSMTSPPVPPAKTAPPPPAPPIPDVAELRSRLDNYRDARRQQIEALVASYRGALQREQQSADAQNDVDGVGQIRRAAATLDDYEPKLMAALDDSNIMPPPAFAGTASLVGVPLRLEGTFRDGLASTEAELRGKLQTSLAACVAELAKAGGDDPAARVREYGEQLIPLLAGDEVMGSVPDSLPSIDLMNLAGWQVHGDAKWRMEDDALVTASRVDGLLYRTLDFDEFELSGEMKADGVADGGVGFWQSVPQPSNPKQHGYHLQVLGPQNSLGVATGSLVSARAVVTIEESPVREGEWAPFRIRATRDRLQGWVGGVQTFDIPPLPPEERIKGRILLLQQRVFRQHQGQSGTVGYRKLKVTPIGAASVGTVGTSPAGTGDEVDGWTSLFNGRDLEDWEGSDSTAWTVEGGAIWKRRGGPRHIYRSVPHREFEIEGEFRATANGNGGIHVENVGELALVGSSLGVVWTGGIWGLGSQKGQTATPDSNPIEDDTWTPFHLQLKDGWFRTRVDGREVSEMAVEAPPGELRIGLEGVINQGEVAYRGLRIRPVGRGEAVQ